MRRRDASHTRRAPLVSGGPVLTPRTRAAVALPAVVLVALTLRGPVSSVGPLLDELSTDADLPSAAAALLTSLPLVCFGLVSPLAPVLSGRLGLHRAVLAGATVLAVGLALRGAGVAGLFVGTLLVGAGIATGNVLLPAVAKADFGAHAPSVTGVVTACMALSATLGAGLAQPLRQALDSPVASLVAWTAPAALAALVWWRTAPPHDPLARDAHAVSVLPVLRDPVARAVTVFLGLQSLTFYTVLAWLPQVLRDDAGMSAVAAGVVLAVLALLGVPVSLVVPRLAARRRDQTWWVVAVAAPNVLGLVGLLLAPAAAPEAWSLLIGLGTGASFPLALTLVVLRSRDAAQTARLSAAAQGVGYLLAATGPVVAGSLHDATGGWDAALAVLAALVLVQVVVGLGAGRDRAVAER